MFELTHESIEKIKKERDFSDDRVGGVVTFEGLVRNHNDGHKVTSLEYQAYEDMALLEGQKILDEAKEKFDIRDIYCVHRLGHLKIGEAAIWIIALSDHRKAAFLASEFVINTVKLQVPIWKKEHYVDKKAEWIACHNCAHPHEHQSEMNA